MLPIVATLLSNGLNLLGNAVLAKGKDWVSEKTGIDLSKPELTSADFTALRQAEMEHEEELIRLRQTDDQLSLQYLKEGLASDQDARKMQIQALSQEDNFSKRFIYYFAIAWSTFCTLYILGITFIDIPQANVRFADTILGFLLGTIISQMFSFFYGSSKSSQGKDKMLSTVINEIKGKVT